MNKNLLVILFIAVSNILFGQKPWKNNNSFLEHFPEEDTNSLPQNFAAMGDLLFNNFEYEVSAEFYEQADSLSSRQLINHSLCYYSNNDFINAINPFEKALEDSGNNSNPNVSLFLKYHYAVSLKNIHEFEESKELFQEFYKLDSNDSYINLQLSSIDSLMKWDSISFIEKVIPFTQVNTKSSEFSTSFYDDGIFYITEKGNEKSYSSKSINFELGLDSLSKEEKAYFLEKMKNSLAYGSALSPRTSVYKIPLDFSSLFCSDSSAEIPKPAVDSSVLVVSHKGFNVTNFSSEFNSKTVYYTRHPNLNKWNPEASIHPLIFKGTINNKRKKLTHRKKVNIKGLPNTFGSGEVSISSDGNTIYFVSDKRRGEGGTDIYVTHKNKSGNWGKAINLGAKINTPFDEESPKIYDDSILFFASNGYFG